MVISVTFSEDDKNKSNKTLLNIKRHVWLHNRGEHMDM